MSTAIEICNLALIEIGSENFIDDFAGTSREEVVCNLLYEQARDYLLSAYTWNFARGRVALSATTAPDFGWDYAFLLPADCLRAIKDYGDAPFVIEGDTLLTNASDIELLYIKKETDTAKFSPFFKQALIQYLASRLAEVITADHKRSLNLKALFEKTFREAKRLDAMEGTPTSLKISHRRRR